MFVRHFRGIKMLLKIVGSEGFEPPKSKDMSYSQPQLATLVNVFFKSSTKIALFIQTTKQYLWAVKDSNLRSRKTAELQSAPVGHFGNCPSSNCFAAKVSSKVPGT
jgi:hypothetical protein